MDDVEHDDIGVSIEALILPIWMKSLGRFSLEMWALNGMGKSYRGTSLSWIGT